MTILGKFYQDLIDNPHVYEMMQRFTREAIKHGKRKFAIHSIWERMRWELEFTKSPSTHGEFKLNDHLCPYYARLFMHDFPEYGRFFEVRRLNTPGSEILNNHPEAIRP